MMKLPEHFVDTSLEALAPSERESLLWALENEPGYHAMRLRPSIPIDLIKASMPGEYTPVKWERLGYYVPGDGRPGTHPLHAAGAYYLQEPSAMAAVAPLDIQPGQCVLDLCAAPGGKSTQIAARLMGEGVLVANEPSFARAKALSQNIERMGIPNALVTNEMPDLLAKKWESIFDRILVDAPCSGEGMFRRTPAACSQWSRESIHGCANRQLAILHDAAKMLRPGGILVYSTCTFNTYENEGVCDAFLRSQRLFRAMPFSIPGVGEAEDGRLHLWPHRLKGEGHFVAKFEKGPVDAGSIARPVALAPPVLSALPQLGAFFSPRSFPFSGMVLPAGSKYWLLPAHAPDLSRIKTLRLGLALGEKKGEHFVPDHALAMAMDPALAPHLPLGEADARLYLRGEVLSADEALKGWMLVSYQGLSLGWGKCVSGMVKNHLPKGLRRHGKTEIG